MPDVQSRSPGRGSQSARYFDELAGKFGRAYVPGRSWKGIAEALLKLLPPMVIADLGAGEGTIAQLMAQRAEKVIAIHNSEKMGRMQMRNPAEVLASLEAVSEQEAERLWAEEAQRRLEEYRAGRAISPGC
jgi:2-polyprenyl-3-methyl-5-hydroxy-6-metoxy-1,4-benzoquinol methylase